MNSDGEIRGAMRRVDRDLPLDDAAAERVEARMLNRYDRALDQSDDVLGSTLDGATSDEDDVRARLVERRPSHALWLARAAIVLLIAGGALLLVRAGDESTGPDAPADSMADASETPATTVDSTPTETVADGDNALGYRSFTSYTFSSDQPIPGVAAVADRAGELTIDGPTADLGVRQTIQGDVDDGSPRSYSLSIGANGLVDVPLDWLDPEPLGGVCTGGEIPVGRAMASARVVIASCAGLPTDVSVEAAAGDPQMLALDGGGTIAATPVTITLTPEADQGAQRSVTLWFGAPGLVRRTHSVDGQLVDLQLDQAGITQLGAE